MTLKSHGCKRGPSMLIFVLVLVFAASQVGFCAPDNAPPEPSKLSAPPAALDVRPFSTVAVGVTFGTLGAGAEVVTPLARRVNLRGDAHYFSYSPSLTNDGISYSGDIKLSDGRITVDYYIWRGLRVSGGVEIYNRFDVNATATVPAGQTLTLNHVDYYSSATDPVHGSATAGYAHNVAPTFTFGFGNQIPRNRHHLAFPVELGVAYTGAPTFNLTMAGSACAISSTQACQPVASYSDWPRRRRRSTTTSTFSRSTRSSTLA